MQGKDKADSGSYGRTNVRQGCSLGFPTLPAMSVESMGKEENFLLDQKQEWLN